MHFLFLIPALLVIDQVSSFHIPNIFQRHNASTSALQARQETVRDVTVNLGPTAADALGSFFRRATTFADCPPDLGGPKISSPFLSKRQFSIPTLYDCLTSVHRMSVAEVVKLHPLESLYTSVTSIVFNIDDSPTFKDLTVQVAHADSLLAGAKMLEIAYPKIDSVASNKITGALFLATHAKFFAKTAYYGYYGVSAAFFSSNENNGHCGGWASQVDIECSNPYCKGETSVGCSAHTTFFGCPCKAYICPTGDDILYCEHCGGEDNKQCKGEGPNGNHKGCSCINTKDEGPYSLRDHGFKPLGTFVDKLPRVGAWSRRDDGGPKCNGIEHDKWVTRDKALSATKDFCADGDHRKVEEASDTDLAAGNINREAHYNSDDRDELHIKLTYFNNMEVSVEDCEDSLNILTDSCDGTTSQNPTNVKHGGSYTLNKGPNSRVKFELIPWRGEDRLDCNSVDSETWMYPSKLDSLITGFCSEATNTHASKTERKLEEGTPNEVILTVDWAEQHKDERTCIDALYFIRNQCGGSTLRHGPLGGNDYTGDFKHGGTRVLGGRSLFSVQPQKSALCGAVSDMSCSSSDTCTDMVCPSGYDWYLGGCINGKCACGFGVGCSKDVW